MKIFLESLKLWWFWSRIRDDRRWFNQYGYYILMTNNYNAVALEDEFNVVHVDGVTWELGLFRYNTKKPSFGQFWWLRKINEKMRV